MLTIPKQRSLHLSLTASGLLFVVCVLGAAFMPRIMETLIRIHDTMHGHSTLTYTDVILLYAMAYAILAVTVFTDALLLRLLLRVRRGMVFTPGSIRLIRGISWCCFLIGFIFIAVGIYFRVALCITLLAGFLGLCVRVVKNVIEEATAIKSENDLTV